MGNKGFECRVGLHIAHPVAVMLNGAGTRERHGDKVTTEPWR